jgi:hypothetical protein
MLIRRRWSRSQDRLEIQPEAAIIGGLCFWRVLW